MTFSCECVCVCVCVCAVSYTHLDVYKRQTYICHIFGPLFHPYQLLKLLEVGPALLQVKERKIKAGRES